MASHDFTRITTKQRIYLDRVTAGDSKRLAARKAGYSEGSNTSRIETPQLRAQFARLVRRFVPMHKLAQRVAEGLDAQETKFFQSEGVVTDSRDVINYSERRQYAQLAAELCEYTTPAGEKGSGPNIGVKVIVEHIGADRPVAAQADRTLESVE